MSKQLVKLYDITNRQSRRAITFEHDKLVKILNEVEFEFVDNLFEKSDKYDFRYKELYNVYLKKYIETVNWINNMIKPKFFKVNELYFTESFYLLEKEIN